MNNVRRNINSNIHINSRSIYRRSLAEMEVIDAHKIRRLNEKCLELEERLTFLEATMFKFRSVLEPGKVKAVDIKEFCETIDDYFKTMAAVKHGNKIGLA